MLALVVAASSAARGGLSSAPAVNYAAGPHPYDNPFSPFGSVGEFNFTVKQMP